MARTHSSIALDSEEALRKAVGPDATAAFESDPKFIPSDPTATASSENIAVQRDTDDTADSEEEETEAEDLDDEDEEDEDDDEEEEDEEDEAEEEDVDDEEAGLLQARSFDDLGEADDDSGDVDPGLDEDALEDDDLDTVQIADPGLNLRPFLRMVPSTSARAAHHAI